MNVSMTLMLPSEMIEELKLYRKAYSMQNVSNITTEQSKPQSIIPWSLMFDRWFEIINENDPEIYQLVLQLKNERDASVLRAKEWANTELGPRTLKFVNGHRSLKAHPGTTTPFYAIVGNDKKSYERSFKYMLAQGWTLTDNNGNTIDDVETAWMVNAYLTGKKHRTRR